MNNISFRTLILLILVVACYGCASLNIDNMVVGEATKSVRHPVTVAVTTSGGTPTVQWYSGTISPEEFRKAIIISLEKVGLFEPITGEDLSDYILNADIQFIGSHPGVGMTAWEKVEWSLVKRAGGGTIWTALIVTEGHAGAFEAFDGRKRQFLALERGAKENIEQALREIRKLNL